MYNFDSAPFSNVPARTEQMNERQWPLFQNGLVAHRIVSLLADEAQALPHFAKAHGAVGAWRIDPNTMTPWVFLEFDALPDAAAQSRIEEALQDAAASSTFLC